MKKRIRLTESGLTNLVNKIINEDSSIMKDKLLSAAEGMSEAEKGGWVKLIKECIAEFDEENPDFSRDIKVEAVLSGLMLLFILGAILLDFDIAAVLGVGGLVMLGDEQIKKWKKVIECAKNKKNNTIEESRMKKTIRLTESELINLVQRIIKEDEMMDMEPNLSPKKIVQDIIKTGRFDELQEGMMVSIKNNKLTILPGELDEEYVIDLSPKTHRDVIEQQTKIKVVKGKLAIKFINGEVLTLEPSMKVIKFNL